MKSGSEIGIGRTALLCTTLVLMAACASPGGRLNSDRLAVDRVATPGVQIGEVYVRTHGRGLEIEGSAEFAEPQVGVPRDRLAVTLRDPGGTVLYAGRVPYYRHGRPSEKAQRFEFTLIVPIMPPPGSVARLVDEPMVAR